MVETRCLDVGGRLIGVADGTITKLATPARIVSEAHGFDLSLGDPVGPDKLSALASAMAALAIDSLLGPPYDQLTLELSIGSLPDEPQALDAVVFIDGVGRLVGEYTWYAAYRARISHRVISRFDQIGQHRLIIG